MKGRYGLLDRLDLPGETLPGQVIVEIAGENRVLIEQHRGIREYTRERISVCVRYGMLEICGQGLELRSMSREQLIVCGQIDSVTLRRRTNK
jgi:sporulation protein YqfC